MLVRGRQWVLCRITWSCVEMFFSCALAHAPNSILQCFLKSMMVPVMSVHREIVQNMPTFTGITLIQKWAFSTMRDIIMFEIFLQGSEFHVLRTCYSTTLIFLSIFGICLPNTVVLRVIPLSCKVLRNTSNLLSMYNVFIIKIYLCIQLLYYRGLLIRQPLYDPPRF